MAVVIDNVYQKVLALANKEQRGYLTPQEFNLLADKAQKEIYSSYFHHVKETKLKSNLADESPYKLHVFKANSEINQNGGDNTFALPTDLYKINNILVNGHPCRELTSEEVGYSENNPLTKATSIRPVFERIHGSPQCRLYPMPQGMGFSQTYNTATFEASSFSGNSGVFISIDYFRLPSRPNWTYVIINEKALFNVSSPDAQAFELHESEEENLVNKILILAGVTIQKPDLQQAGAGQMQIKQQEQNS